MTYLVIDSKFEVKYDITLEKNIKYNKEIEMGNLTWKEINEKLILIKF